MIKRKSIGKRNAIALANCQHTCYALSNRGKQKGKEKMITFWGQVALATLAAYVLACWLISKIPNPKRQGDKVASVADALADGNKDRSEAAFHGWH